MAASGSEIEGINPAEIATILHSLRENHIESIAVCFMNSYANPQHERQVAEIAARDFPEISLSLSSEVLPEVREFERFSTTAINAYVKPNVELYMSGVAQTLVENGFTVPLYLIPSGGGVQKVATENVKES